jgi:hypothetical protein
MALSERPLLLNHVEMVYRPSEVDAAQAFFEAMGFGVSRWASWLVIKIDPEKGNGIDNGMYANEPTPAQLNFEAAFEQALASDSRLAESLERHRIITREWPYYNFHFGASIPTHEDWEKRVERLREANRSHPLLKDRIELVVFEPSTSRALSAQSQAFVFTDILTSGGPFSQGLQFEIQWTPTPDSGELTFESLAAAGPGNPFPDMATMV